MNINLSKTDFSSSSKQLKIQITESAIQQKLKLIPLKGKIPLIKNFLNSGSYDKQQIDAWQTLFPGCEFGLLTGQENQIIVLDVDFQKKEGKIIGKPLYGKIPIKLLQTAGFKQKTLSGSLHYFFLWDDRFSIFSSSRIKGTTLDLFVGGKQVRVYQPLDFSKLTHIPDDLYHAIKESYAPTPKTKKLSWKEGDRNHSLFKTVLADVHNNRGRSIPSIIEKSENSGLDKKEIMPTVNSAVRVAKANGIDPGPQVQPHQSKITPTTTTKSITLISDTTKVTDIKWQIKHWFEQGALSIIAGMPGMGKTTLSIAIAVLNALKLPIWTEKENNNQQPDSGSVPPPPKGDGRPSLYVCFERKKQSAINKIFACGGNLKNISIMDKIKIGDKEYQPDFSKKDHLEIILNEILTNKYAFIILDPLVNLELDGQNKNEAVRKKMESILSKMENSTTCLLGVMHLKKDRKFSDDLGSIRGASEWENVASCVHKIKELKDEAGLILTRLKVNESSQGTKGGLQFKIESCQIPDMFREKGSTETTKGGIRVLNYIDKTKGQIDKMSLKEFLDPHSETPDDKILKVIARLEAEKKELNTSVVKDLAKAEGVTDYYLQRKLNWNRLGYKAKNNAGKGKDFKRILHKVI